MLDLGIIGYLNWYEFIFLFDQAGGHCLVIFDFAPGQISRQSSAIDFTSHRANVNENQANVEHTSHSGLTPSPVTSNNIGSPVPSTQIPHHLIIPQTSDDL
ncbi:hypothetical protein O181_127282 [Austropuccinia psidii MF-1]|uniref:Uncharacterized protein n=1 Tax=Austropuccinia psidii MF-1 TaxID=1389203 RepID=A0A9Q3KXM5_9BASI|nr:hypothetical protein [Austropuccinia psidii MF-1]